MVVKHSATTEVDSVTYYEIQDEKDEEKNNFWFNFFLFIFVLFLGGMLLQTMEHKGYLPNKIPDANMENMVGVAETLLGVKDIQIVTEKELATAENEDFEEVEVGRMRRTSHKKKHPNRGKSPIIPIITKPGEYVAPPPPSNDVLAPPRYCVRGYKLDPKFKVCDIPTDQYLNDRNNDYTNTEKAMWFDLNVWEDYLLKNIWCCEVKNIEIEIWNNGKSQMREFTCPDEYLTGHFCGKFYRTKLSRDTICHERGEFLPGGCTCSVEWKPPACEEKTIIGVMVDMLSTLSPDKDAAAETQIGIPIVFAG